MGESTVFGVSHRALEETMKRYKFIMAVCAVAALAAGGASSLAGASTTPISSRHGILMPSAIPSNPADIPGAPAHVVGGEPTTSTGFSKGSVPGGGVSPLFTTPKSSCDENVEDSGNWAACLGANDINGSDIYVVAGGENQAGSWYGHVELVNSTTGGYWNSGEPVTGQNDWLYIGPELSISQGCDEFYGVVWEDDGGDTWTDVAQTETFEPFC
jgi:hypothetical protein